MDGRYLPISEMKARGYDLSHPQFQGHVEKCERIDQLLAEIEKSFGKIPRPRITLHVARAYDDEWAVSNERGLELRKLDPEEDWREVSEEKTSSFQEYFSFSDAEGWRFYLPAFMTHFLLDFPEFGFDAVYRAARETEDDRLSLLDQAQRRCVANFVRFCDDYV